jgi:hypothetical protein
MQGTRCTDSESLFEFRCGVQWQAMRAIDAAPESRRCDACERTVHLCRTRAEFEQHARRGNCVAVYESGPLALMTTNSSEKPDAPENPPLPDDWDPFGPDGLIQPPVPTPVRPVHMPTAGVPRKPE